MAVAARTLILGLGNPLRGDDGVGPRVVAELAGIRLPAHVAALDAGTAGLTLLDLLDGPERVIVVDAADMGRAPGEVVRFTPEEGRLLASNFTPHAMSLAEALELAQVLGRRLPQITILGVQPASLEWRAGLSPAVAAALPAVIETVLQEVRLAEGADNVS